jgi:hypothetical protein
MCGGHVCRLFFSRQVLEYAHRAADSLPESGYTTEEEEAGFKKINETFGFYGTLDSVARYVNQSDKEVLKWSADDFYNKLKLMAWRAHAQKRYSEIMNAKNKS